MPLTLLGQLLRASPEIVAYEDNAACSAHAELFRFADNVYLPLRVMAASTHGTTLAPAQSLDDYLMPGIEALIGACNSAGLQPLPKIHITLTWQGLVRVAMWKSRSVEPDEFDALLSDLGVSEMERNTFKGVDVDRLFTRVFCSQRLNILRMLCRKVQSQIQGRLKVTANQVICHLVAADTRKIVASTL